MRAALFLAALLGGCQFDGGFGTGLLCPTGACPAGQVCRDGVCGPPGGDSADASAGMDGGDRPDGAAGDAAVDSNLVDNPGMEEGTGPWVSYNGEHTTTDLPHGGAAAMRVCSDPAVPDFSLYQDVVDPPDPAPQGAVYAASVWLRAEEDTPDPGLVRLTIRERGGAAELLDHDSNDVPLAGTEWIQLQVAAAVQEPDRTTVIFIVWGLSAQEGDCFAVDDALVVPP